jgi:hypothetical protein
LSRNAAFVIVRIAAKLDSTCFAFTDFHLRFHTETHRAKFNMQFRRADSDAIRFVALAKEQLTLVTDDEFHGTPFCTLRVQWPTANRQ